jgi:hypothetical protein
MQPVFGDETSALEGIRNLGGLSGESYVDKDLRTLLHDRVNGRFNLRYCGKGSLEACRASLWNAVDQVAAGLASTQGQDPAAWRTASQRTTGRRSSRSSSSTRRRRRGRRAAARRRSRGTTGRRSAPGVATAGATTPGAGPGEGTSGPGGARVPRGP